jgi:hypothetical protein
VQTAGAQGLFKGFIPDDNGINPDAPPQQQQRLSLPVKEVTFAHQDMLLPLRVLMEAELEKATGYKINWRMFGGGGAIIKASGIKNWNLKI